MLDEAALYEVLGRMPPRSAELVSRVALDGWSLPELAERYGIPEANAARLVLRAARDCDAAARGDSTPAAPLSDEVEASQAPALARALERLPRGGDGRGTGDSRPVRVPADQGSEPAPRASESSADQQRPPSDAGGPGTTDAAAQGAGATRPLAELLAALATHRDGLKRRLAEAEAAAARSPTRTREVWLRRLAIAVILALTAYFYWRDQHAPPPPPLPRPALPAGGH